MSKRLAPSDVFKADIYPSVYLISLVVLAILLGVVSLFLALGWIGGFLLPLVGWIGFQEIKKVALLSNQSIVQCQHISPDFWRVSTRVGHSFLVKRQHAAYRSPWLIILSFETIPQRKPLVLPLARDSLTLKNYTLLLSRLL